MKRQFTLLLASVLVVFALTACGGNDKDTNQDNNGQNTVGEDIQNAGEDIMDAGEDVLDPDNNNNNNNSNKDNGTGDHKNDQNTTDRGDSALTGGGTGHLPRGGCRHQAEQPSRRILRTNAAQCPGPRFRRASDGP